MTNIEKTCEIYSKFVTNGGTLVPLAKRVRYDYYENPFDWGMVTIDALSPKDYPHGININSIYLKFKIDFKEGKIELYESGHINLSPSDKQSDKYRYYCMKSMIDAHVDLGGKKFRKTKYKDVDTTVQLISNYFNAVMESVKTYTGGYPYLKGVI